MNQVDEQRNPRTKATVNQLMDRYLELLDVEETTHERYEQAILRSCRAHCDGQPFVEHAVAGPHECTAGCTPLVCRPLATSSIRKVHFCLSGALARAIRWRWITVNQLDQAEPPRGATSDPDPPTTEQAQQILSCVANRRNGARFALALALGLRKGEALGLKWCRVNLDGATLRPSRQLQRYKWEHGCDDPHACGKAHHRAKSCPVDCRKHQRKPCPAPYPPGCTAHASARPKRHGEGFTRWT